ncbi:MAG: SusD/RagB family nutrient-binding outer membrane lipoprotein [Chitinophagaceae bacterium]
MAIAHGILITGSITNIKEMYAASVKAEGSKLPGYCNDVECMDLLHNLTDAFGDVPMEEAARGDEQIFRPKFNKQQDIYPKLLNDLDPANRLFVTSKAMIYGTDILYGNNVLKWKKILQFFKYAFIAQSIKKD